MGSAHRSQCGTHEAASACARKFACWTGRRCFDRAADHQFDRGAELAEFRAQPLPIAGLSRPAADLDLSVR